MGLLGGRPRLALAVVGEPPCCAWPTGCLSKTWASSAGVGTDPNSMVPTLLVVAGVYVALVRVPAEAPLPVVDPAAHEAPAARTDRRWWEWVTPTYLLRAVAAGAAVVLVLVGAAPMVLAATNPNADPILTEALDGTPNQTDSPAPPFRLTDQHGRPVSLESLRPGRPDLLRSGRHADFRSPPEFPTGRPDARRRRIEGRHGGHRGQPGLPGPGLHPGVRSPGRGATGVSNWLDLTGSLSALQHAWAAYGITTQVLPGGSDGRPP